MPIGPCKKCLFFAPMVPGGEIYPGTGDCRKSAPRSLQEAFPDGTAQIWTGWPATSETKFCGDFEECESDFELVGAAANRVVGSLAKENSEEGAA